MLSILLKGETGTVFDNDKNGPDHVRITIDAGRTGPVMKIEGSDRAYVKSIDNALAPTGMSLGVLDPFDEPYYSASDSPYNICIAGRSAIALALDTLEDAQDIDQELPEFIKGVKGHLNDAIARATPETAQGATVLQGAGARR